VTDSVTSDGLTVFIENKLGMQCLLYGAFFIYFFICLSILFLRRETSPFQARVQECNR